MDSFPGIEFIAVLIKLKHKNLFITCSYIPPNSPQSLYDKHGGAIKSVVSTAKPEDLIIVSGDFNLPSISWKLLPHDKYFVPSKSNNNSVELFNILYDLSLFQLNGVLNHHFKLLDLIFVNETAECYIKRSNPITIPEDRYHPTIEINIYVPPELVAAPSSKKDKAFCFKQSNYILLNELLNNTNWNNLLSLPTGTMSDIDRKTEIFYNKMYSFMDICIPKLIIKELSGPPWNTKQLARAKNKKNKYYRKYKQTGSLIEHGRYMISRSKYNSLNNSCYSSYLVKMKNNFKHNPKSFYKFVNSKKNNWLSCGSEISP